ncbi:MAG: 3-dehydroquinate synthase [Butyrivibrio sp.]|nr:3-dehydroquinate synthase [Butyrivibrio sp.]
MSEVLTVNYDEKPCYDIIFTDNFGILGDKISELGFEGRKVCIVTDSNVKPLYANEVLNVIEPHCSFTCVYELPAGENNKNLDEISKVYEFLIENHFDRNDLLLALGGGVVGDMTGFIASTYLRGIAFIQIPTTLLAQADSSIGGKTGVDFKGYKNMVGAFYMPRLVYMNLSTLKTLDGRQYASGFAEIMKHGLIKDQKFYIWLLDHIYEINDREMDTLIPMLKKSCSVKKAVVENDPKEKGERALLNFGHTLGHAIEKARNFELFHGECVALGCIAASFISWKRNLISMDDYYEIRDMFVPFNLPISVDNIDIDEVINNTKSDKKVDSKAVKFILLNKIGKAFIDTTVTEDEMRKALEEILWVEDNE